MHQLVNVLLDIDEAQTVLQRVLDGGPGLGGLTPIYKQDRPTPSAWHSNELVLCVFIVYSLLT